MNNTRTVDIPHGLSNLRFFLLQESVRLNKLLREDTKDWPQIENVAHQMTRALNELKHTACYEMDLLDHQHDIMEGTPRAAQLIFIDFVRADREEKEANTKAFVELMNHVPS